MPRIVFALILLCSLPLLCAAQSRSESKPAARTNFTSVYTDLKRDCKAKPEPKGAETGSDPLVICKSVGGYRISIGYSAMDAGISIESLKDKDDSINLDVVCSNFGGKVEWRLANGKPFAVIIRLGKYKDRSNSDNPCAEANRLGSTLVVKGMKGWQHINFEVDGATPNANVIAREKADQNYSKK